MTDPTDDRLRDRLTAALIDVAYRGKELTPAHAKVLADTALPTVRALIAEAETRGAGGGYKRGVCDGMAAGLHAAAETISACIEDPATDTFTDETRVTLANIAAIFSEKAAIETAARADRLEAPSE